MSRWVTLAVAMLLALLPALPYSVAARPLSAAGGPDAFGYTWDDSVTYAWIDATSGGGVRSGLSGDDGCEGPVALGFTFPFYENGYASVYFNTEGLLRFGASTFDRRNMVFPNADSPNNVMSALWADLEVLDGGVYYRQGGVTPNRWFVVQYQAVHRYGRNEPLTFQTVLHENGDIRFQYADVNGSGSRRPASRTRPAGWGSITPARCTTVWPC